jgi:hypothetical protein
VSVARYFRKIFHDSYDGDFATEVALGSEDFLKKVRQLIKVIAMSESQSSSSLVDPYYRRVGKYHRSCGL